MNIHELKVGVSLSPVLPVDSTINTAKMFDEIHCDFAYVCDHWMGWISDALWTPELVPWAAYGGGPHDFVDCYTTLGAIAQATSRMLLGTGVTDALRRHPAELAQAFLTLDHISRGRAVLGIGPGEVENLIPYGVDYNKPVSKLQEAIKIIKLLWTNRVVNYDGAYWKLKDAVIGIPPYKKNSPPPIWVAAHRPRALKLTGELADGWFPLNLTVDEYADSLRIVRESAGKSGRDPGDITTVLNFTTIMDDDHQECHRMFNTVTGKLYYLESLPPGRFSKNWPDQPRYYGYTDFIPTREKREEIMQLLNLVTPSMCEQLIHGTVDEVIGAIEKYLTFSLDYVVIWDLASTIDPSKIDSSLELTKKLIQYIKG